MDLSYYRFGNMSIKNMNLGQRLFELRKERLLTQKQVADMLDINSVTYLRYEKNQREPPIAMLIKFAQFYDVSVDYLLGLADI